MFTVCGLNYKTAPLLVREAFALALPVQLALLNQLLEQPNMLEAMLLSTCNRTEIYCDTDNPDSILPWLANKLQVPINLVTPHCYIYQGNDAILHVLRVAVGIDSMMLGEPQILGQMKQAYQEACRIGSAKRVLHQTFQYVFSASKRIRNISGIGHNPVSIAFAGAQLISRFFDTINALNVLVIGSGETASLVAKYLRQQGVTQFMFASRTLDNASRLANTFEGESFDITALPEYFFKADVVVSATACPLPFITKRLVAQAMTAREKAPMFLLDLAVPRDIEASVSEINGVQLYNIDDLNKTIEKGMNERRKAAIKAEELIDKEAHQYSLWQRSLRANEAICGYRNQMKELAQIELYRAKQKLLAGQCQHSVLEEFSERLINKLTHTPTIKLREAASDQREELFDLAQFFINKPQDATPHEKVN